ncbi:PAP fibrillin [Synechococcus sp. RSCCF101]|nr:PAP fibrillin [Synechococcus sp. RSCCF101]
MIAALESTRPSADPEVEGLLSQLERQQPADLDRQAEQLEGVWELRWSSSSLPYLRVAPWLDNLQVLSPSRGLGMNLLRLKGPLAELASIRLLASISVQNQQRVQVRFTRGGWQGPQLLGRRLALEREVSSGRPAWLDITVLDERLRICRGNAGTLFALLRRKDLAPDLFLPDAAAAAATV